jgi:hypothetical protein
MAIAPATSNKKDGTFTSGFARGKPSAPSGTSLMQSAVPSPASSSAYDRGDPAKRPTCMPRFGAPLASTRLRA